MAACAGSWFRYLGTNRSPQWGLLRQELWSPLGRGMGSAGGRWGGGSMWPREDGTLPAQLGVGSGGAVLGMDAHLARSPTAAWGWSHRLLSRHEGDVALTWHPGHAVPADRTPGAPGQRQVPASAIDQSPLSRYWGTTGWGEGPAAQWGYRLGSSSSSPGTELQPTTHRAHLRGIGSGELSASTFFPAGASPSREHRRAAAPCPESPHGAEP